MSLWHFLLFKKVNIQLNIRTFAKRTMQNEI